jgi:hypothetical protein
MSNYFVNSFYSVDTIYLKIHLSHSYQSLYRVDTGGYIKFKVSEMRIYATPILSYALNLTNNYKTLGCNKKQYIYKQYYAYPEDLRGSPPEFLPVVGCNLKGQPIVADL